MTKSRSRTSTSASSFRMFTSQLIVQGSATQGQVANRACFAFVGTSPLRWTPVFKGKAGTGKGIRLRLQCLR